MKQLETAVVRLITQQWQAIRTGTLRGILANVGMTVEELERLL